jgi:hypothetical protein
MAGNLAHSGFDGRSRVDLTCNPPQHYLATSSAARTSPVDQPSAAQEVAYSFERKHRYAS